MRSPRSAISTGLEDPVCADRLQQAGKGDIPDRSIGPWYYSESDLIDLLNANIGLKLSKGLSLGIFAHNLLDDRGHVDPISILDYAVRARPRTFGVEFGATF
jgi:outer membrane receptor protein involved in Fe transport